MIRANQRAYSYIRERILDGTYRPTQRLVETALATEIGVSRNTITKALLLLSEERLVEIESNKGASVSSLTIDEIEQYYEVREALEVLVVRAAVLKITEKQLEDLKSIFRKMKVYEESGDVKSYSNYNLMFHQIIYDASGKECAVNMIKSIKTQLSRFQFRTMIAPGRSENSIREHEELLDALVKHNQDAAEKAITRHINNVALTIVKYKELFN